MPDPDAQKRAESETPTGAPAAEPKKSPGLSNLTVRLLSAAVGIPIILWMLFGAPKIVFSLFGVFAGAMGAYELGSMVLPDRDADGAETKAHRRVRAWLIAASAAVTASLIFLQDSDALVAVLFGVVLSGALATLAGPRPMSSASGRMGWLIAGPIYVGGALASIAKLHHFDNGGVWVVLSMVLAWGSDTGGYFAGRAFGKHKLYELVSPKKTMEGSVGGLVTVVAAAVAIRFIWLPELPTVHAVVLGLVAGAVGQAGDLCVSVVKRSTGVKDSGNLIPGHGGLLDRVDALMFTAMVTWAYARWVLGLEPSVPTL